MNGESHFTQCQKHNKYFLRTVLVTSVTGDSTDNSCKWFGSRTENRTTPTNTDQQIALKYLDKKEFGQNYHNPYTSVSICWWSRYTSYTFLYHFL